MMWSSVSWTITWSAWRRECRSTLVMASRTICHISRSCISGSRPSIAHLLVGVDSIPLRTARVEEVADELAEVLVVGDVGAQVVQRLADVGDDGADLCAQLFEHRLDLAASAAMATARSTSKPIIASDEPMWSCRSRAMRDRSSSAAIVRIRRNMRALSMAMPNGSVRPWTISACCCPKLSGCSDSTARRPTSAPAGAQRGVQPAGADAETPRRGELRSSMRTVRGDSIAL